MVEVKIKNLSNNPLPYYATVGSAGLDLRAFLNESIVLKPGDRIAIPTGIYLELPDGFQAEVRPRSGIALKNGVTVLNSPGTIDCDYRGEIKVILINLSKEDFLINNGDRIAQMIITKYEKVKLIETEKLNDTDRNWCGFGSSGQI